MVRLVTCVVLMLLAFDSRAVLAQQEQSAGVAGIYRCEGTNPDGSPYTGVVEIRSIKDTFLVRWTLANNLQVLGVGIFRDGLLAVSYFGGSPAVAMYKLDGERLVGQWTMGGTEGMTYSETLTKLKSDGGGGQPPAPDKEKPAPDKEKPDDDDNPRIRV